MSTGDGRMYRERERERVERERETGERERERKRVERGYIQREERQNECGNARIRRGGMTEVHIHIQCTSLIKGQTIWEGVCIHVQTYMSDTKQGTHIVISVSKSF